MGLCRYDLCDLLECLFEVFGGRIWDEAWVVFPLFKVSLAIDLCNPLSDQLCGGFGSEDQIYEDPTINKSLCNLKTTHRVNYRSSTPHIEVLQMQQ